MTDPRIEKQAKILVDYSTKVKKGEVVQITGGELAKPLILAVYRQVLKKDPAEVKVHVGLEGMDEIYFATASKRQLKRFPNLAYHEAKNVDVRIGISAPSNTRHLSGVDPEKFAVRSKVLKPIKDQIVEKVRWVISDYPTAALAQEAEMSLAEYEDFLFGAIVDVDWKKLTREQEKLARRFNRGEKVRIVAPGTDLTLSIKGRLAVSACGEHNMPDGEVFTSVVENSTSGRIRFSYPAIYRGREVEGIELEFDGGRVVGARARKGQKFLETMLKVDEGASRLGELGIGNNFMIDRFTKNILFDEKIGGTVHLALGSAYKETRGENESAIHWDMICDLREEGELYLDDELIQRKGKWLI
jgi:aminopeptidase